MAFYHHTEAERKTATETLTLAQHGHPLFVKVERGTEQRKTERVMYMSNVEINYYTHIFNLAQHASVILLSSTVKSGFSIKGGGRDLVVGVGSRGRIKEISKWRREK